MSEKNIYAQILDAAYRHRVAVETAAVHPQQYGITLVLPEVYPLGQDAASITVHAACAYYYFLCHCL